MSSPAASDAAPDASPTADGKLRQSGRGIGPFLRSPAGNAALLGAVNATVGLGLGLLVRRVVFRRRRPADG